MNAKRRFHKTILTMVLSAIAVCAGFSSCSSNDDNESTVPESYLPESFSAKTVEAKYVKSETGDYPSENVRNYSGTYTFYFFSDKTWIMTAAAEWTQYGQKVSQKFDIYEGTFTKTGDYTNGTLKCKTTKTNSPGCTPIPPAPSEIKVEGGKFTVQSYVFTKQ